MREKDAWLNLLLEARHMRLRVAAAAGKGGMKSCGRSLDGGDNRARPVVVAVPALDVPRELGHRRADLDARLAEVHVLGVEHTRDALGRRGPGLLLVPVAQRRAALREVVAGAVRRVRVGVVGRGRLLVARRQVAVAANLAGRDAALAVAEDDRDDHVGDAKGHGQDARGQDEPPQGQTQVVNLIGRLDEVAEERAAHDERGEAEPYQRVVRAQHRPAVVEVCLEEADLGDDEEDGDGEDEEVGDGVEEVEVLGQPGDDDHGPARHHDGNQPDDGEGSEGVEDQVAGAPDLGVLGKVEHVV